MPGRSVVIPGMSMVEMRNSKFYRDNFYFDSTGVLRQIGLMPSIEATQTLPGRAPLGRRQPRARRDHGWPERRGFAAVAKGKIAVGTEERPSPRLAAARQA